MKYLISVTEVFRVDKDEEAKKLIQEAKEDNSFELKKYSNEYKERKQKGEIVDAWHRVTLVKQFNNEKEPYIGVE